jgi:hypothetical protein
MTVSLQFIPIRIFVKYFRTSFNTIIHQNVSQDKTLLENVLSWFVLEHFMIDSSQEADDSIGKLLTIRLLVTRTSQLTIGINH